MTESRGRGRPREGVEKKKAPLNLRTDWTLRESIARYAFDHKLSLTQAAERLVRRGLEVETETQHG